MIDKKIFSFLWLSFALTFPLFSIEYFRLEIGVMMIPIPVFILFICIFLEFLLFLAGKSNLFNPFQTLGHLFSGLLVIFLLWHICSIVFFKGQTESLKVVVKLLIAFLCMFGIINSFPREKKFIEKFWLVVICSSAFLMSVFIYRYAIVFDSPFLSNYWEFSTRAGRNQLMWYLIFIMPLALSYLWGGSKKWIALVPVLILVTALIYSGARGPVVSVLCGLVAMILVKNYRSGIAGVKNSLYITLFLGVVVGAAWIVINQNVADLEVNERIMSLAPGQIGEVKTENRWDLLQSGLEKFSSSPVVGVGLGNNATLSSMGEMQETHNDYLKISVDLGLLGLSIFVAILLVILYRLWPAASGRTKQISWVSLGTFGSYVGLMISLFLINAYESAVFWIFVGLALVGKDIRSGIRSLRPLIRRTPVTAE